MRDEFYFPSKDGNTEIHTIEWKPDPEENFFGVYFFSPRLPRQQTPPILFQKVCLEKDK